MDEGGDTMPRPEGQITGVDSLENGDQLASVTVSFPFPSERICEKIYAAISVDPEPKRSPVTKRFSIENNTNLKAELSSPCLKSLKKSAAHLFDMVLLLMQTVEKFDTRDPAGGDAR